MNGGRCGQNISGHRVSLINGRVMGDQYTGSYLRCPRCDAYMIELFRDSFSGSETRSVRGPIDEAEVRPKLQFISQCPEPTNDRCTCAAHRSYFGEAMDT